MKQECLKTMAGVCLGLMLSTGATADPARGLNSTAASGMLADHFGDLAAESVELLDPAQMQDTQGALWPLIGAVVTVDLALATFFWGTYVPAVTGTTPVGGKLTLYQD